MVIFVALLLNVILYFAFDAPVSHIVMIFVGSVFIQGAMLVMREEPGRAGCGWCGDE